MDYSIAGVMLHSEIDIRRKERFLSVMRINYIDVKRTMAECRRMADPVPGCLSGTVPMISCRMISGSKDCGGISWYGER